MKFRRIILGAGTVVVCLMVQACSGSAGGSKSDSTGADTAVLADTAGVSEDSLQDAQDVKAELLDTPDLRLLEVKGNVKSIKTNSTAQSARFDENGNLTHYGYADPIDKISNTKRNADGNLTAFLGSEWMKVKWKDGRPASIESQYNEMTSTETYTYDDAGRVVKITYRVTDSIEGTDDTEQRVVSYPADGFDEKGNWVKRTVKFPDRTETETRTITYY